MKVLTCLCVHCRYRLKRQKKHGEDIITYENRAARRIVNQILKNAKNIEEIDIHEKRPVRPTA